MTKKVETNYSRTHSGSDSGVPLLLGLSKEYSALDATSRVSSAGHASVSLNGSSAGLKVSTPECGMSYPTAGCYGYYYPGYDGFPTESDGQIYVPGVQYPVMQTDVGSFLYFCPGSGYSSFDQQLPVSPVTLDGQYFGQQLYAASPMVSPTMSSPGIFPTTMPYGSDLVLPSYTWDSPYMVADGLHGRGYAGVSGSHDYGGNHLKPTDKASHRSSTFQSDGLLRKGYHEPKHAFNHQKKDTLHSSNPIYSKGNGNLLGSKDKTKSSSKGVVGEPGLNEQKHDSRASGFDGCVTGFSVDGNGTGNITIIRRDQYNVPDFLTRYDQALFFVIKSYSEDDIHKSIKYNVWASTPNGNKRLDCAYQSAQEKAKDKGCKCPVFLFFSVNASGQFCGVAEMVGRVNFDKSMDFWQQDKWNGYFPVKWHIIKDVPNPQLRHIILENNDNKPVTNSRDTQEVLFPQGIEMLNLFKNYALKTSILDDFVFYENRQRIMQSRKKTSPAAHFDHRQNIDEIASEISSIDLQGGVRPEDSVAGDVAKE